MHCNVRIGAEGDPVLFPEYAQCTEAELAGFGILQNGTESGKCSTGIYGRLPDGKIVWIQISASMFMAMAGAVKGAQQRFGDVP